MTDRVKTPNCAQIGNNVVNKTLQKTHKFDIFEKNMENRVFFC